jgi:hypothetical protein
MGIASLGGATLDNEENYLMKKLYSAMGAIQDARQRGTQDGRRRRPVGGRREACRARIGVRPGT